MALNRFYIGLSIGSIGFGILLLISAQLPIAGSAVGLKEISSTTSIGWAVFFILAGICLFYVHKKNN